MVLLLQCDVDQFAAGSRSQDGIVDQESLVAQRREVFPAKTHVEGQVWSRLPIVLDVGREVLGTEVALGERRAASERVCCNRLKDGCVVRQGPEALKSIGGTLLAVQVVIVLLPADAAAEADG